MVLQREKFSPDELRQCLSHYDLGRIRGVQEFNRGSRRSPKVVIESDKGRFLFKRRSHGKDDLQKVAFTHSIQLVLSERDFPLPHLVNTSTEGKSMLVIGGNVYEMFEFVAGGNYDGSGEATFSAGKTLATYHSLLEGFDSEFAPPSGSYHEAKAVHNAIFRASRLPASGQGHDADAIEIVVQALEDSYKHCARRAESLGLGAWSEQIVHGDWHPGNMLFRDQHVEAVIDYDAARVQAPVIDLANGCLQYSIIGRGYDVLSWPAKLDEQRLAHFIRGYDSIRAVSAAEIKAVPFLMCEAMIAEAVLPIAATGSFGRIEALAFLEMINRKVRWILSNIDHVTNLLSGRE